MAARRPRRGGPRPFAARRRLTPLNSPGCAEDAPSLAAGVQDDEFLAPGAAPVLRRAGCNVSPGKRLRRDMRVSVRDAVGFSLMVGAGESYFAAFALAAGAGEIWAGLVTTAPLLLGAMLQLITPWAIPRVGSHRRWVVLCAGLQAGTFLPLAVAAWAGRMHTAALYAVVAVYWGAGLATAPAWNTWMGRIVPAQLRARWISLRTRLGHACLLSGFLIGGVGLQWATGHDAVPLAFAALFALAGAARGLSTVCLAAQHEPRCPVDRDERVPLRELARRIRHAGDGRLIVYLLAVQVTVQIAGPFFTPFMLKQIRFTYAEYVALASSAFVGKVAALALLGRIAQRYGAQRLLAIGGLGICPLSALWLVSHRFEWLLAVQALGGAAWAAYELAMSLLWFESVAEHERTSVQTTHNFAHALATCTGSLIGGGLLWTLGQHPAAYLTVFAVSAAARLATLPLLARVPGALWTPNVLTGRVWVEESSQVDMRPTVEPTLPDEEGWPTRHAA